MADVILVQPIIGLLDNIKSSPALPLSLIHAASIISKEYEVKVIDQRIEPDWAEKLSSELKKNPICVGTTCMLGPQIKYALEICKIVKDVSNVPVVWGGPHGSTLTDQTIANKYIDFVITGDGEVTFYELVKALEKGKQVESVKGIFYKINGEIKSTPPREFFDLNEYPEPPYNLVDVKKYLPIRFGRPTIDMETSRGCPYSCTFCYNPTVNRRHWRALTAENVLIRIKNLSEKYSVDSFWFIDDEMFIDLKRAKKIINGLNKMNVKWTVQGVTARTVLNMDDEMIKLMEDSGCKQINIGAESGSDRMLLMLKKGIVIEEILAVNNKLKNTSIAPWFYFVVGFPTETVEELKMTVDLISKLLKGNPKARISGIGCYTPYPGTPLFEESKKYGYVPPSKLEDWSTYAVDNINVPWLGSSGKAMVEGLQFVSFFVDNKPNDIAAPFYVRIIGGLYRSIAFKRMESLNFKFPIEIKIGNIMKKRIIKNKCF